VSSACLAVNESVGVVDEPELEGDSGVVEEEPRLSARAAAAGELEIVLLRRSGS